jgi:hypothetical protein
MAPCGVELRDRPVSKPAVATAAPFPPSRLERLVNAGRCQNQDAAGVVGAARSVAPKAKMGGGW